MEFLDEDARPRFLLQSRAPLPPPSSTGGYADHHQKPSKPFLFCTISISLTFFAVSLFFLQSEPSKSLIFWIALSILLGPFAPSSITGGDPRVGVGPDLEPPKPQPEYEPIKKTTHKRSKPQRPEIYSNVIVADSVNGSKKEEQKIDEFESVGAMEEEGDWNEEDEEVLKKQMAKHPVGKPRRWEAIAAAFGGRRRVESLIKRAKELGEKKAGDEDSYAKFLKNRKPVDKRVIESGNEERIENGETKKENSGGSWSSGEDIALLNALKVFPKEVAMRWEKIAAAVPGKTKAACMKRVSELKRDFRSSKAGAEG